jgi:hypothetical protein
MKCPLIFPEAMACKNFCVNLGNCIEGEFYIDNDFIIFVEPSIWAITLDGNTYSCHIIGEEYFFEKGYKLKWEIEMGSVPNAFRDFVKTSFEYESLQYPKLKTFIGDIL